MNEVNLIGYLGKDFDPGYTPAGKAFARNSLAITKRFKNSKGNEEAQTTWINIVIFGKAAETAYVYFPKGSQFACSGEITSSNYKDEETGKDRTSISVLVRKFYWIGKKQDERQDLTQKPIAQNNIEAKKVVENSKESEAFDKVDIDESQEMPF